MSPDKLLELFRLELNDTVEPYFWSDTEFYTYLNEAHDVFIRLIGGIADSSSPLTIIKYKAGDTEVKFDERILRIKGVRDANNNRITLQNYESFVEGYPRDDYGNMANAALDDGVTGTIRYLLTDVEDDKMKLYPVPDADGTLYVRIYRTAINEIENSRSEIESPSRHHLHLLAWVKYRALSKQDAETFELGNADDFKREFIEYVTIAAREKSSREDRPRTVRYGGL